MLGRPARDRRPTTELLLLCERSALQALFDALRRFKVGFDCELHKRTLERGLLSLIGPRADALAGAAAATEHASEHGEHRRRRASC